MKKIRHFKCGHCQSIYEKIVDDDTKVIDCECGKLAVRQLSAPRHFGNTVGSSPSRHK